MVRDSGLPYETTSMFTTIEGEWDECMDVVQAVVSLLDAEGFTQEDVDAAIERCNERNRERGRL